MTERRKGASRDAVAIANVLRRINREARVNQAFSASRGLIRK
jgi:hypothetical protein